MMDTPDMTRAYCPGCEPEADPTREALNVYWCMHHRPEDHGDADVAVRFEGTTNSEAGGESNRAFCAFFHRGQRPA